MKITELRGLRFPDEYVVKMFFKEGLHHRTGSALELGCGNGNNLMLFAAYGWDVTGIDISEEALADARHNLEGVGRLLSCDLEQEFPALPVASFDAILLPSVNYYVSRPAFLRILQQCRRIARPGAMFYLRARLPQDWRWGRGQEVAPGAFRLECRETREYGLLNVFYGEEELEVLLAEHLGPLVQAQHLRVSCDNPQGGIVVRNEDLVIWGRFPCA